MDEKEGAIWRSGEKGILYHTDRPGRTKAPIHKATSKIKIKKILKSKKKKSLPNFMA